MQQAPRHDRHSAEGLRAASRTFSGRKTSTYDGLNPRHFDALSDAALRTLAVFLDVCEDIGAWPDGINAVVTSLIPKAKRGVRRIERDLPPLG